MGVSTGSRDQCGQAFKVVRVKRIHSKPGAGSIKAGWHGPDASDSPPVTGWRWRTDAGPDSSGIRATTSNPGGPLVLEGNQSECWATV